MAYDRADYSPAEDAVRIAFFVTWAMLNDLEGQMHLEDDQEFLEQLRERNITPRKFLEIACDDKFWEEDLSDQGNDFARAYYLKRAGQPIYAQDYERVFLAEHTDLSAVADTWNNYDKIALAINERHEKWKRLRQIL